jgi:hypothetical protein
MLYINLIFLIYSFMKPLCFTYWRSTVDNPVTGLKSEILGTSKINKLLWSFLMIKWFSKSQSKCKVFGCFSEAVRWSPQFKIKTDELRGLFVAARFIYLFYFFIVFCKYSDTLGSKGFEFCRGVPFRLPGCRVSDYTTDEGEHKVRQNARTDGRAQLCFSAFLSLAAAAG